MERGVVDKEDIKRLIQGKLPWDDVKRLIRLRSKDPDRFLKYLAALQELVPWDDRILLRISERLYIVLKPNRERVVKCECGYEFGDYRENWKIKAMIYVRNTQEERDEIYQPPGMVGPKSGWGEIREYYCQGCGGQHAVEIVPPGYPPIFEILPDLDTFYKELGQPLDTGEGDWYQDLTACRTAAWAKE